MTTQKQIDSIHFEKASLQHEGIIFQWLNEPHVQEFWDNSPVHRKDILIFLMVEKNSLLIGLQI